MDADITNAVKFDSSVKFNGTADSRPAVDEYRFYRDQSLLGSNSTGIYHLQLRRSGSYSCVPVNSAGSGEKATLYIAVKGKTFRNYFPQMHVYVLTSCSPVFSVIRYFRVTLCLVLKESSFKTIHIEVSCVYRFIFTRKICAETRFETEAQGNSEMIYLGNTGMV